MAGQPLVELRGASKFFGSVIALKDISMAVSAGAVVAQQAHHLAGPDTHGDVLQRDHGAEELRNAPDIDQRRVVHHLDSVTFRRMKLLNSTATSSMAPIAEP